MASLTKFRTVGQGAKLVRVHKAELTRSKSKGERMIKFQLKITEGKYEGETLFAQAMLEGKGAFFGTQALTAINPDVDWSGGDFPEDEDGNLDEAATQTFLDEALVEQDAIAQVTHQLYEGKLQVRVNTILPANASVTLEDDAS